MSNRSRRKAALIIGVSDYDNLPTTRQLSFCKNDAEAIYSILKDQNYEIPEDCKLVGRVKGEKIKKAIRNFFRIHADSKDTLLFYFSGHGIPDGYGSHYLASSDIDPKFPEDNGYAFSELESQARKSPAKKIVTILDCCFSGAAELTMGDPEDIAKSARVAMDRTFQEGDGKCILASSLGDQESYKMKGEPYSLFTYCLIDGMKGGKDGQAIDRNGYVTPYTLGSYVYEKMLSLDRERKQKPITKAEISGNFILLYYPELIESNSSNRQSYPQEKELANSTTNITKPDQSNVLSILIESAHHYFIKEDYNKAIIFFDRILEINPNHVEALNNKGLSLFRLKKYEEALMCYEQALAINPMYIQALSNKDVVLEKLKEVPPGKSHEVGFPKTGQQTKEDLTIAQYDNVTLSTDPLYEKPTLPKGYKKEDLAIRYEQGSYDDSYYRGTMPADYEPQGYDDTILGEESSEDGKDYSNKSTMGANDILLLLQSHDKWKFNELRKEGILSKIELTGVNLQGAYLIGYDLSGARLRDATLIEAELWDANFSYADLSDAKLRGAQLQNALLVGANLQGADLGGANLQGANLSGADLKGTDLVWADLSGADLRGARMNKSTRLTGTLDEAMAKKMGARFE